MNRKNFVHISAMAAGSLIVGAKSPTHWGDQQDQKPSQLDVALVQKFVGAGHGKMDIVQEIYMEYPAILNAAHDWGGGDFETALGAASHVGHKELAQYLIDKGAQTNIFTAALFGKLDLIKSTLEYFPNSLNAIGPHGFTLLHHAMKGGSEAEGVVDYLKSLGAKELKVKLY